MTNHPNPPQSTAESAPASPSDDALLRAMKEDGIIAAEPATAAPVPTPVEGLTLSRAEVLDLRDWRATSMERNKLCDQALVALQIPALRQENAALRDWQKRTIKEMDEQEHRLADLQNELSEWKRPCEDVEAQIFCMGPVREQYIRANFARKLAAELRVSQSSVCHWKIRAESAEKERDELKCLLT